MSFEINDTEENDSLDLHDLLIDEQADLLSEYLSVSIENISEGIKVSVTTVEEIPITYSSTLTAINVIDFQYLIDSGDEIFNE